MQRNVVCYCCTQQPSCTCGPRIYAAAADDAANESGGPHGHGVQRCPGAHPWKEAADTWTRTDGTARDANPDEGRYSGGDDRVHVGSVAVTEPERLGEGALSGAGRTTAKHKPEAESEPTGPLTVRAKLQL